MLQVCQEWTRLKRFASVKPSAATLIRVAFKLFESLRTFAENCRSEDLSKMLRQSGTPGGTRTPDLLLRRQLLYPAELLAHLMERVTGIGPAYPAWKAGVLPLNYTRKSRNLVYSARKF